MTGVTGVDGARGARIGATLVLLLILYVPGYGLLRATHVLTRHDSFGLGGGPLFTVHGHPMVLEEVRVSPRNPHLRWLEHLYAPLVPIELWSRDALDWN